MSDFHRAFLEMAWLRLCQLRNETTEIENCYSSLNRVLRWLYMYKSFFIHNSCTESIFHNNLNRVMSKPEFRVLDLVRHKLGCTAIEGG